MGLKELLFGNVQCKVKLLCLQHPPSSEVLDASYCTFKDHQRRFWFPEIVQVDAVIGRSIDQLEGVCGGKFDAANVGSGSD